MMKRLLSLLIALMLVLSSTVIFAAEETAAETTEEATAVEEVVEPVSVEEMEVYNRIGGLFNSLGLEYSFSGETVTRAEFISTLMNLINLAPNGAYTSLFTDVTPEMSFNPAVYMAAKLGFISEGGTFEPDRPITYAEACKILVTALGYSAPAYTKGGYPYGFMQQASQLDLGLGLEMKEDSNFTIYDYSLLLSNAIEINACAVVGSATDSKGESYRIYKENGSLLEIYRELYRVEGVLSGNGVSYLYDEDVDVSKNRAMIGNETYVYEIYDSLGLNVNGFYRLGKDGFKEIVYLQAEGNKSLVLDKDCGFKVNGTQGIYLDENGKERKLKIDAKVATLYNDVADKSMDLSNLTVTDGYIEIIDNDEDGDYDVVSVKEYKYMIVNKIDLVNRYIYSESAEQSIDLSDERTFYKIDLFKDFEDLPEGSCIAYTAAKDGRYYDIKVCGNKIKGVIDTVVTDAESTRYVIDGVEYEMTNHFYNKYTQMAQLGVEVEAYITDDGKLIALSFVSDKGFPYGIIYGAAKESGLFSKYQVRIFGQDGVHYLLNVAKKVKLNGENAKDSDIYDAFKDVTYQIIRYSVDSEGCLKGINTAADLVDGDTNCYFFDKEDDKVNAIKQFKATNSSNIYYRASTGAFMGEYIIGASTKVFCVDEDETDMTKAFKMSSYNTMTTGKDPTIKAGKLTAYNVGKDGGIAGAVIFKTSNTDVSASYKSYGVIVAVEDGLDNEETEAKIIQIYKNDQFYYYYLKPSDYTETLEAGDLVLYTTGNNGYLASITCVYDCSESKKLVTGNGGFNTPGPTISVFVKGKLVYIGDSSIIIDEGTGLTIWPYTISKHAFVSNRGYVYTQSKNALIGEWQSGQELDIILRLENGVSNYLIVYEK